MLSSRVHQELNWFLFHSQGWLPGAQGGVQISSLLVLTISELKYLNSLWGTACFLGFLWAVSDLMPPLLTGSTLIFLEQRLVLLRGQSLTVLSRQLLQLPTPLHHCSRGCS